MRRLGWTLYLVLCRTRWLLSVEYFLEKQHTTSSWYGTTTWPSVAIREKPCYIQPNVCGTNQLFSSQVSNLIEYAHTLPLILVRSVTFGGNTAFTWLR